MSASGPSPDINTWRGEPCRGSRNGPVWKPYRLIRGMSDKSTYALVKAISSGFRQCRSGESSRQLPAALSIGGPIGGLFGGGAARNARDRHKEQDGPENQLPFTVGVIVLGAKMAKADGSVTTDDVKAFSFCRSP